MNKLKQKSKKSMALKYFLATLGITSSLSLGIGAGYFANLVKDQKDLSPQEIDSKFRELSQNSEVYFSNGEKAVTINSELIRKSIPLEDMGLYIQNAIIASEDADFYNNHGVEPKATARAIYSSVKGENITGGSTLTQQLVKNQLLDNSRTFERKAKEILLALKVDKYFTKKAILENYLNMATFGKNKLGQNISGIETAARGIFGIPAKELNIAQAAYLAGFVQSPFRYTPFDSNGDLRSDEELQAGFDRQKYVLDRMLNENYITKSEYNDALNFDIKAAFITELADEQSNYPYITNEVIREASQILAEMMAKENGTLNQFNTNLDFKNDLIEKAKIKFQTGGYKVTTTIDKSLYDSLQAAKNSYTGFTSQAGQDMQIGASLIENSSGKILAFVGGRDFENQQLNHATQTYRSPGSTIKPLLTYAPAIEKGYITAKSHVLDKRFNHYGWRPENAIKTESGLVSAEVALAKSLNLPVIRLYSAFVHENPVKEYLLKMNFDGITESDQSTLAASIGGLDKGVTVSQNTAAFATLANKGLYNKAHIIENIKDYNGDVIYQFNTEPTRVYSESTAFITVKMLNAVLSPVGTSPDVARRLPFGKENLFLKTGTSEFSHDLWTVGGSSKITLGLWTGFDQPQTIYGLTHAHNQWAHLMNAIYENNPAIVSPEIPFEQPTNVKRSTINPRNNSVGWVADYVPNNFTPLDNNKINLKFGINIDKNISFGNYQPSYQTLAPTTTISSEVTNPTTETTTQSTETVSSTAPIVETTTVASE